ncbi:MAG: SDR family NAD(P)-dependent oxidoreductase [Planctomycetes bacterium]|jgi:meso-butanediol dehydrogenase/(S,S)-butanediol dehydrogenase/diacetyl reductase|nr:SDR family NAD(P)-dependent oxidoreductase [Planctomycetota bacterium]
MSEKKIAIVTGAGSGIGRSTALLLAEAGYTTVLVGRTESKLEETAKLIAEESPDAQTMVHAADVTDEEAVQALIDAVVEKHERIDVIANVAGYAPLGPIARLETDEYRKCLAANLDSVVFMTRAAWPVFKKQKSGFIANVSSMASVDPFTGFNVYGAAKAGVNLFTKATADEGKRIKLNAVAVGPGAVETEMLRDNFSEKAIPKDMTLDPAEVAAVIRDCITGDRDFERGETILLASH